MKKLLLSAMLILMLMPISTALASPKYNVYYSSFRDEYVLTYVNSSQYQSIEAVFDATSGYHYQGVFTGSTGIFYITCNGRYNFSFLDGSGTTVDYIPEIVTTQISNPSCSSHSGNVPKNDLSATVDGGNVKWNDNFSNSYEIYKDGDKVADLPSGSTNYHASDPGQYSVRGVLNGQTNGVSDVFVGNDITLAECATQICNCIKELMPSLNEINQNTNGLLTKMNDELLPKLDGIDHKLAEQLDLSREIKTVLEDIHAELKPNQDIKVNSVNDYHIPTLEENKPSMPPVYRDSNVYFTDQGDEAAPPAFPTASEPESWKDVNGNVINQQPKLDRQPVQTKSPVLQKDSALSRDPKLEKQVPLHRDAPLHQDKTEYPLRWKSSDFVP